MKRLKWIVAAAFAACALGTPVAVAVTADSEDSGGYSSDLGDARVAEARAKRAAEPAPLPAPHPLTGEGENFEIVANVPIDFGADIELHGDYAYVSTYGTCSGGTPPIGTPFPGNCTPGTGGVTVIDISDPEHPERVGLFDCAGGQNDVQLSPDGKLAGAWPSRAATTRAIRARRAASSSRWPIPRTRSRCPSCRSATARGRSWARTTTRSTGRTSTSTSTCRRYNRIDIFDLTNPAAPVKLPGVQYGPPAFGSTRRTT